MSKRRPIAPQTVTREQAANAPGVSLSTLKRMINDGQFPSPRQLSPGRVGWFFADIEDRIPGIQDAVAHEALFEIDASKFSKDEAGGLAHKFAKQAVTKTGGNPDSVMLSYEPGYDQRVKLVDRMTEDALDAASKAHPIEALLIQAALFPATRSLMLRHLTDAGVALASDLSESEWQGIGCALLWRIGQKGALPITMNAQGVLQALSKADVIDARPASASDIKTAAKAAAVDDAAE